MGSNYYLAPIDHRARSTLEYYLPPPVLSHSDGMFLTLTYAASLDSRIAVGHGMKTHLSGPETKSMTHYLRSRHDAILVGANTIIADDPGLNCRYPVSDHSNMAEVSPRPIIIDPHLRTNIGPDSRLFKNYRSGHGKAPWILISGSKVPHGDEKIMNFMAAGGVVVILPELDSGYPLESWSAIFNILKTRGIRSIMIEGGAYVINSLLDVQAAAKRSSLPDDKQHIQINSFILTIAPVYLGIKGVEVSPRDAMDHLEHIEWFQLGRDSVVAARFFSG
ncbi:dihydrofolate reductase-like domain-containing protein [Dipodascopsis uninucleata]